MTSAQVVETSVNVISNSPSQDYTHPDDRTLLNYVYNFPVKFNSADIVRTSLIKPSLFLLCVFGLRVEGTCPRCTERLDILIYVR